MIAHTKQKVSRKPGKGPTSHLPSDNKKNPGIGAGVREMIINNDHSKLHCSSITVLRFSMLFDDLGIV